MTFKQITGVVLLLAGIIAALYFGFEWQSALSDLEELQGWGSITPRSMINRHEATVTKNLLLGLGSLVGVGVGAVILFRGRGQ